jgi:cell division protein FtsQ
VRVTVRLLGGALFVAAAVVVGAVIRQWLRTTPLLAVTTVDVHGTRRLAQGVVRAAAAIPPGSNLLVLDAAAIRERVEALPGVARAAVVRELPHRVSVAVEERVPYALVHRTGADQLAWVDAGGHLVGVEPRPGVPALPILSGVERTTGPADAVPPERLRLGLALLRAVQRTGGQVLRRVSEIDLAAAEGPLLYLTDGTEVRLGAGAWDERLARLDGVLGELERTGERVVSIDLRFRDQVVLKPSETAKAASPRVGAAARRRSTTPGPGRAISGEHR